AKAGVFSNFNTLTGSLGGPKMSPPVTASVAGAMRSEGSPRRTVRRSSRSHAPVSAAHLPRNRAVQRGSSTLLDPANVAGHHSQTVDLAISAQPDLIAVLVRLILDLPDEAIERTCPEFCNFRISWTYGVDVQLAHL